jgi:multidrug efflux system membrane fusion protein
MKNYFQTIWSNSNYRMSIVIALVTGLWMMSGVLNSEPVDKIIIAEEKNLTRVKAQIQQAQVYTPAVPVRARTEANRRISLRAEVEGQVVGLKVAEGDVVKQGDTVCELAVQDRQLRVVEAKSAVDRAQLEYSGALRLKSSGYQSETAIAGAKANLDAKKADMAKQQIDFDNVTIKAPFTGIVERHGVEVGGYMTKGGECAILLQMNPLVVTGQVSEANVSKLHPGMPAKAVLTDGQIVDATIRFVGFDSDPVTRMFRIEAVADNSDFSLRSGMTTDLQIIVGTTKAHQIPAYLLSLDDRGKVGVRILDEDDVVEFVHVDLLGDDQRGIWVGGLPETTNLITVGQEYVAHGEKVAVTYLDEKVEPSLVKTQAVVGGSAMASSGNTMGTE